MNYKETLTIYTKALLYFSKLGNRHIKRDLVTLMSWINISNIHTKTSRLSMWQGQMARDPALTRLRLFCNLPDIK